MKLYDIGVAAELRASLIQAKRVLADLQREHYAPQLFINGIDVGAASGQDRTLVRAIAIQVWQNTSTISQLN